MPVRKLTEEEKRKVVFMVANEFGYLQFKRKVNPDAHDWLNIEAENCCWNWDNWEYRINPSAPFRIKYIVLSALSDPLGVWLHADGAYSSPSTIGELDNDESEWPVVANAVAVIFNDLTVRDIFLL